MVFVTHDVREAVRLADRIIVMSSRPGRVVHDVAIPISRPRDMGSADAVRMIGEITTALRAEVRRHAPREEAELDPVPLP